jgi:hypothetical protein
VGQTIITIFVMTRYGVALFVVAWLATLVASYLAGLLLTVWSSQARLNTLVDYVRTPSRSLNYIIHFIAPANALLLGPPLQGTFVILALLLLAVPSGGTLPGLFPPERLWGLPAVLVRLDRRDIVCDPQQALA